MIWHMVLDIIGRPFHPDGGRRYRDHTDDVQGLWVQRRMSHGPMKIRMTMCPRKYGVYDITYTRGRQPFRTLRMNGSRIPSSAKYTGP